MINNSKTQDYGSFNNCCSFFCLCIALQYAFRFFHFREEGWRHPYNLVCSVLFAYAAINSFVDVIDYKENSNRSEDDICVHQLLGMSVILAAFFLNYIERYTHQLILPIIPPLYLSGILMFSITMRSCLGVEALGSSHDDALIPEQPESYCPR